VYLTVLLVVHAVNADDHHEGVIVPVVRPGKVRKVEPILKRSMFYHGVAVDEN